MSLYEVRDERGRSFREARLLLIAALGAFLLVLPVAVILGPSNEVDGFRLLLGLNQDELVRRGTLEYPLEDRAQNHQCHRLAARISTRRYGALFTLAGGIGNELVEAFAVLSFGHSPLSKAHITETWNDLAANWRGILDAEREGLSLLFVAQGTSCPRHLGSAAA